MRIGVLALQGAFAKHLEMLRALGVEALEIRKPQELEGCDGLIIPGGESTTMMRLLKEDQFIPTLSSFKRPIFGTCAGLILMSKAIKADTLQPFGFLEVDVERNAYGRQAESFQAIIQLQLEGRSRADFPALFIRAPRIRHCGSQVEVLASYEDEPVLVRQGPYLGSTFHPELTENSSIHAFFKKMCKAFS